MANLHCCCCWVWTNFIFRLFWHFAVLAFFLFFFQLKLFIFLSYDSFLIDVYGNSVFCPTKLTAIFFAVKVHTCCFIRGVFVCRVHFRIYQIVRPYFCLPYILLILWQISPLNLNLTLRDFYDNLTFLNFSVFPKLPSQVQLKGFSYFM